MGVSIMAANVKLDWDSIHFQAAGVSSWRVLKQQVADLNEKPTLFSDRAVYVIRISRPFAFDYAGRYSPVAYIGKGQAQLRLTSHLKSWIPLLAAKIPDLGIRIYFCEPKVRRLGTICEGVEADLIDTFKKHYGRPPLQNRNTPSWPNKRIYSRNQLHVLHPGKGKGFHWALRPLPSSQFYRA